MYPRYVVEVGVRDAFAISAVIGVMVTVMSSMMAFFAGGMDDSAIQPALRTGIILGSIIGAVVLIDRKSVV